MPAKYISCQQFERRLNDLLDERVDPRTDSTLAAHAAMCEPCHQSIATYSMLIKAAEQIPGWDADATVQIAMQSPEANYIQQRLDRELADLPGSSTPQRGRSSAPVARQTRSLSRPATIAATALIAMSLWNSYRQFGTHDTISSTASIPAPNLSQRAEPVRSATSAPPAPFQIVESPPVARSRPALSSTVAVMASTSSSQPSDVHFAATVPTVASPLLNLSLMSHGHLWGTIDMLGSRVGMQWDVGEATTDLWNRMQCEIAPLQQSMGSTWKVLSHWLLGKDTASPPTDHTLNG